MNRSSTDTSPQERVHGQPKPSPFDVIRSLDKRRREYRNVGWLYIMRSPAFREPLLKIGKSRRPPPLRAEELAAATAVPEGFQIVYFVHVSDHHAAEAQVHAWLAPYRKTLGKEFFSSPVAHAIEALERVADLYPVIVGRGKHAYALPQIFTAATVRCPNCGLENRIRRLAVPVVVRCRNCATPLDAPHEL